MRSHRVNHKAEHLGSVKSSKPRFFYGYVVAFAVFGIWLIGWGTYNTFGVFFRPVLIEFGWTRAEAILGFSFAPIVMAMLGIITGWLTDRLGPMIIVMAFGSFLGISYLLLAQISEVWQFQAIYALIGGIGMSALTTPVMATVARWFVQRRGMMIGIAQAGLGIGGLIFSHLKPSFSRQEIRL